MWIVAKYKMSELKTMKDNFIKIYNDKYFWIALKNTFFEADNFGGYSFDVKKCVLSIYDVFRAF